MKPVVLIKPLLLLVIIFQVVASQAAEKDPVYTGLFSNLAIKGFDAVAYFTEGRAVEGSREFSTVHQGAEWRFSGQAHLAMFLADPEAYAPQYGGYCAYAVAQGDTASAEPDLWTIYAGKLYLNYNRRINQTWTQNMEQFIRQADQNWPAVLSN